MVINTIAYTNGMYCGFFDINELITYANKCLELILDEVWFGKKLALGKIDNVKEICKSIS